MISPDTIAHRGFYRFTWRDFGDGLSIQADHIRETNTTFSAELVIKMGKRHLVRHRTNLLSVNGKQALATKLQGYWSDAAFTISWIDMIEWVAETIIDHHRAGDPIVTVGDKPISTTPSFQLWPFVPMHMIAMIYGQGATGKSTIADAMALSVQTGKPLLGWVPEQTNVLILDYEMDAQDTNDRLKGLQAGLELLPGQNIPILYKRCARPLAEMGEELRQACAVHEIGMIIVDSAVMAVAGNPNSAEDVKPMYEILRELNVSTLLISHPPKDEGKGSSPYGSAFFYNWSRCIFEVKAVPENNGDLSQALYHRKINRGAYVKPLSYRFTFDNLTGLISIKRQSFSDMPLLAVDVSGRILEVLKHGAMSYQEIAEATLANEGTVKKELSKLKARGLVMQPQRGLWGLPARL